MALVCGTNSQEVVALLLSEWQAVLITSDCPNLNILLDELFLVAGCLVSVGLDFVICQLRLCQADVIFYH